jgi:muramoyltetrapeptide carboxypeptidase
MAKYAAKIDCSMEQWIPRFLKPGDKIGIAATARWIAPSQLERARSLFSAQDWELVVAENVFEQDFQLAGSDTKRALGLQKLLDNPDIRAIIIARGGYGTVRVIDQLDFSRWKNHPSWICGYSDITVLLSHLVKMGYSSIHSSMPVSFEDCTEAALVTLCDALKGDLKKIEFETTKEANLEIRGRLVGGNLSVLYSLIGSVSYPKLEDTILFVEDVDEMVYHIDRMMMGLGRAGVLAGVKAILVGGLTQMKDNTKHFGFQVDNPFGGDALDMIRRVGEAYGIPVISGFPAGHQSDNRAFYIGRSVTITARDGSAVMSWS